jgi:hypothetical protein
VRTNCDIYVSLNTTNTLSSNVILEKLQLKSIWFAEFDIVKISIKKAA